MQTIQALSFDADGLVAAIAYMQRPVGRDAGRAPRTQRAAMYGEDSSQSPTVWNSNVSSRDHSE